MSEPRKFHTTYTNIAGVTKKNDCGEDIQDLLDRFSTLGAADLTAELERDPENPFDGNAIKVMCNSEHIGYIKRELAAELALHLDSGDEVICEISEITGGGDKTYGCNLKIMVEEAEGNHYETTSGVPVSRATSQTQHTAPAKKKEVSRSPGYYKFTFWVSLIVAILVLPLSVVAIRTTGIWGVFLLAINLLLFWIAVSTRKKMKR